VLQIFQQAGLDPKHVFAELAKEREAIDRVRGDAGGSLRGFVIPTLRTVGLFSERIEGHFRGMFSANFGEERARSFNLRADLPEDLDAWLAS
jgi:hypothetical protein